MDHILALPSAQNLDDAVIHRSDCHESGQLCLHEAPDVEQASWSNIISLEDVVGAASNKRGQAVGASYDSWEKGGLQG